MDSTDSISTLRARLMPFLAILKHEVGALCASWLVRLWLVATALLALILASSNWANFQTASLIASMLFPYLVFPWSLVVMVLSVNPVSGARIEAVADGFLSRPVTRYEYLLASWAARVLLVLSVYLVVAVPAILIVVFAKRPVPDDTVTLFGTCSAVGMVGLVLTFLVSMGFLLGTLLRNQLLAVVVLAFLWFPVNLVLNVFQLEEFSPISLNQALPTLLRQPWHEVPDTEKAPDVDAAARQLLSLFTGQPVKPAEPAGFFERDEFEDFSLGRVVLGYGIPTLIAICLATLSFCLRDL